MAAAAPAQEPESSWRAPLRFESADGSVSLRWTGRIHFEGGVVANDRALGRAFGALEDGLYFRRARLGVIGAVGEVGLRADVELSRGAPRPTHLYAELPPPPGFDLLRVGFFREPLGLDAHSSTNHLPFTERNLAHELQPGRNPGVMLQRELGASGRWAAGLFREADRFGTGRSDGGLALTTRVWGLLHEDEAKESRAHVGFGVSRRDAPEGGPAFAARPEAFAAPRLVATGALAATVTTVAGAGAAWQIGGWSAQGEWTRVWLHGAAAGGAALDGWSLQAGWTPGGDRRAYSLSKGGFGLLDTPEEGGAWEFHLRHSQLDLDDGPVRGGALRDWTLAVNRSFSPHLRLLTNLVRAERVGIGATHVLTVRVAFFF